jgi:4-amino-4-deoxy-L-arabinose transferase-like glycosyltransferase
MSAERHSAADRAHPRLPHFADRLVQAGRRLIAETSEGVLVLWTLVAFVAVWMLFWTVSAASVDVHIDADEALGWAQHFAFGYKHPPMTGWLFILWFTVFPRQQWAVDLLNVTTLAVALAITWRLLRDHLDKNRSLLGLLALFLIPLYDVKAEVLNANTVMTPFWAATLLFYLRARRGLGLTDAFLAGGFASLTMLGKYWAVFLFAGMAVAAVVGPGTRRFWRSPAPYVMAAGAAILIAPHVWWLTSARGAVSLQFAQSVVNHEPFEATLRNTIFYVLGAVAYVAGPLIFLAALRPSRKALAGILWPAEDDRRQALVLLLVPLVLPALVNLIIPYRLTPDWTFPNWALLPIVLYASRELLVDEAVVARAGLVVLAATLAVLLATPVIAAVRLTNGPDQYRPHFRQAAELAETLADRPIERLWGSESIIAGMPIYLPKTQRLSGDPLSAESRAYELAVVCLADDAPCQNVADALASAGAHTISAALTRTFLGFSSAPLGVRITVVPPAQTGARTTD